jgi:hypothetical protein
VKDNPVNGLVTHAADPPSVSLVSLFMSVTSTYVIVPSVSAKK